MAKRLAAWCLSLVLLPALAAATPVYLRSTVGAPWGVSTNEAAMDTVFGIGMWSDFRYETVNTASLFSASTTFLFMEGGDNNANELEAFLGANALAISDWVNAGGRLFVNAAPNEGDGMSFGFGVSLNYPDFNGSTTASAVDPAHPIIDGPFGTTGTAWTGNHFSHASLTGPLTSVLIDGSGSTVFGELTVGSGLVLFGGMTTTNWQLPNPEAVNLRENMLWYGADGGVEPVPEPGTLLLLGSGITGLALRRRRRSS